MPFDCDDQAKKDNPALFETFPLEESDLASIAAITKLIRSYTPSMSPYQLRSAAVVLFALERLPNPTQGVLMSFAFSSGNRDSGNYGWASIEIGETEFELSVGEHFNNHAVGGDTETRILFDTQVGSSWRSGDIEGWLATAQSIAMDGNFLIDDNSDHDAIEWDSE